MKGDFAMTMRLTDEGLKNRALWEEHGVKLPSYNREAIYFFLKIIEKACNFPFHIAIAIAVIFYSRGYNTSITFTTNNNYFFIHI